VLIGGRGKSLHEFLLGAFGAEDVGAVGDEAFPDEGTLAHGADKAVVMPVAVLEGDESCATNSCDWFGACRAPLSEQFTETFGAVRLIVTRGEALSSQGSVAISAGETLSVPGVVLVGHTSRSNNLAALNAPDSEFVLVASGAVYFLLAGYEALGADGRLADDAAEAFLVPLAGLVLHLFVACSEDFTTGITPGGELSIVAGAAEDLLHLAAELLVHKRHLALVAEETSLVPVLILVRQVLGVDADDLVAVIAGVGEDGLVALGAVGVVILEHVPLPRQGLVTLPAAEVL